MSVSGFKVQRGGAAICTFGRGIAGAAARCPPLQERGFSSFAHEERGPLQSLGDGGAKKHEEDLKKSFKRGVLTCFKVCPLLGLGPRAGEMSVFEAFLSSIPPASGALALFEPWSRLLADESYRHRGAEPVGFRGLLRGR